MRQEVLSGGGELGARIRAFDWANTPMGPIATWPQSLKTAVRILITSRYAMWMGWGPDLIFLYNDAYAHMTLGKKHPWALGRPAREVWAEIWADLDPRVRTVLETGEATWDEGLRLFLERSGYAEETYHTFSYSPLTRDDGKINGLFCVVTEETERIIGERRLGSLRSLAAGLSAKITEESVLSAIHNSLEANQYDLPFTLTYLFENGESRARLACATGIEAGHPAAAQLIEIHSKREVWPVFDLLDKDPLTRDLLNKDQLSNDQVEKGLLGPKSSLVVEGLGRRFGTIPAGTWGKAPERALLVPVTRQGQDVPAGVLVAGLNPYRQFDMAYAGFIDLIAGQIAAGLANARGYEEERKRSESLAAIDKAKTTFFSNVSHEFRTPLTLMLGPTEDALSMPEKTLRGEELETVHRNELRLLKLVNTLLDFSRLEAGRVTATYQSTDLCGYTMELASVFRSAMEKAGLAYVLDCKPLPQPVYVDREMWEKIVLNLISNALKSTFEGSITVSLRDQSDHAELMVSDTGTGIPQEELGHLFERFRRIENARRRTHEGSGIGLALVHELLILHGGSIAVQSQMEKGTTFTVSIPYGNRHLPHDHIRADEPAVLAGISREAFMQEALSWLPGHTNGSAQYTDPTELDAGAALSVPHTTDAKARVLVVDDNRDMREYVSRLLSSRFEVINAVNGRDALEIAQKRPFDLVLSDVMMPEMDGFQLLAALRENHATSSVPVVLLSARAGEDARIEGMHSGADDYLVKPFTARELIARVETHIKTARIRREAQKKESEALHAERARLVSLFRQAPAFLAVLRGPDHVFEMTNPQYQELIGGRHVLGKTLREALPEAAEQGFNDILDRVYQTGEPFVGNGIALRLARTPSQPFENRYLDFVYQPMREADNSISGIMVLGVDVTERKLAEEAVLQSEKLAAVGRLSASIAHEINNPLEAVTNLLYLIDQERDLPGPVRDFTRLAQQELARVTQIATQTLRFYRQSTGRNAVRVSELLDSVLKLYQGRLTSAGVRVVREYRAAKPLLCFEGELRQVFTNLIGNALDASRTGGQITVREREATDWRTGRKGVLVTVADTGHGMPRETLARIFEPFFSTKGITGTGLGLWVSLEIIQKHEGKIKARSSASPEHHGTVFSVFVPHRDKE